ncbi:glutathione S-transferase family protein [Ruegeria sp. SCP11]|uniref:glutathione S-transferase family protein n=1 Tax=Ruegeria sp. SCP11 TaxID=3141378 RepID=UPI003336F4F8
MANLTLYGPSYSTYTRSVRLVMEEKGVDYDHVEVDFMDGMPAEQIARQPFGKVPAFEHNGFHLYETGAIERYIDEGFDGTALQPGSLKQRARMAQMISIVDNYTYGPVIGLCEQRIFAPMMGGETDEAACQALMPEIQKALGTLEDLQDGNPYLAGDDLSLADLHLAPVFWYFVQTPDAEPILSDKPGLHTWWESMESRESMSKTEPKFE